MASTWAAWVLRSQLTSQDKSLGPKLVADLYAQPALPCLLRVDLRTQRLWNPVATQITWPSACVTPAPSKYTKQGKRVYSST